MSKKAVKKSTKIVAIIAVLLIIFAGMTALISCTLNWSSVPDISSSDLDDTYTPPISDGKPDTPNKGDDDTNTPNQGDDDEIEPPSNVDDPQYVPGSANKIADFIIFEDDIYWKIQASPKDPDLFVMTLPDNDGVVYDETFGFIQKIVLPNSLTPDELLSCSVTVSPTKELTEAILQWNQSCKCDPYTYSVNFHFDDKRNEYIRGDNPTQSGCWWGRIFRALTYGNKESPGDDFSLALARAFRSITDKTSWTRDQADFEVNIVTTWKHSGTVIYKYYLDLRLV